MQTILSFLKKYANTLMKLLPLVAFAAALLWLYSVDPRSFESMWKGRTFELFFVWLISLELILSWENLQTNKIDKLVSARTFAFIIALMLPTMYVVFANYSGLNTAIAASARQSSIYFADYMPLATEYLVFAVLFSLITFLSYGTKGLKDFSVPTFFIAAIGALYAIDNVYPYGQFTPFQFFVPTTAVLATQILSLMGYSTNLVTKQDLSLGSLPYLTATDPTNPARTAAFGIAWPCAGIESFLIFTVVTALFLKRMPISWKAKTGYFAIGAAVTYFINVLRIVTIFMIGMNGENTNQFHSFYGPLYSIAWIASYPLIILGSHSVWHKITNKKPPTGYEGELLQPKTAP